MWLKHEAIRGNAAAQVTMWSTVSETFSALMDQVTL